MHRFTSTWLSGLVVCATGLVMIVFAHLGAVDPMVELSASLTGLDTGRRLWLVGTGAAAAIAGALLMAAATPSASGRILAPPPNTMPP